MMPVFRHMIFDAYPIFEAAGFKLCKMIDKNKAFTDKPFCYAVFTEETKKFTLHVTHSEAKQQFIKNCEELLKIAEAEENKELPY